MIRAHLIFSTMLFCLLLFIACQEKSVSIEPGDPVINVNIDSIIQPPVAEYPGTATFKAIINNPENLSLELRWISSCGEVTADADSAVILLPDFKTDAELTLKVLVDGLVVAEKAVDYQIVPPAFVGNFALSAFETCSGTINYDVTNSPLLLDIYETFRTAVGFGYAWRKAGYSTRLRIPDSCNVNMKLDSHYGYSGRYLSSATREDSLFYFTYPLGQGNFTVVYKWQHTSDGIIIRVNGNQRFENWHFIRRN